MVTCPNCKHTHTRGESVKPKSNLNAWLIAAFIAGSLMWGSSKLYLWYYQPYNAKVLAVSEPHWSDSSACQVTCEDYEGRLVQVVTYKSMMAVLKPGDYVQISGSKIIKVNQP